MSKCGTKSVDVVLDILGKARTEIERSGVSWKGSPFAWLKWLSSRQIGAVGERMVLEWMGLAIPAGGELEGVIVKFSTLWKEGQYVFQQFRPSQSWRYAICFGVSPFDVHAWILPRDVVLANATPQHAGKRDTLWLHVVPKHPPLWMEEYGGDLEKTLEVIGNEYRRVEKASIENG